jgi:MFS family permease
MFLSPFAGYTLSAFMISKIHMRFGQVGIAVIAPICKIIAYVITCVHPPFPVIPIFFVLTGLGNGLEDGAWNAWVGNMENANELMGILHGAYGLGGAIGPLISTAMVTKGGLHWYTWYYVMVRPAPSPPKTAPLLTPPRSDSRSSRSSLATTPSAPQPAASTAPNTPSPPPAPPSPAPAKP